MKTAASHTTPSLDATAIRADFPILSRTVNGHPLVYLDSAASSQKPRQVIDALQNYYEHHNANVHRGLHTLSSEATDMYEAARLKVTTFLGAPSPRSVIFTRNATEAINLVAYSYALPRLRQGDEILISEMEHHANFVPWVLVAQKTGATVLAIPIKADGQLDYDLAREMMSPRTKIVALSRMSNVLGTINDVASLFSRAHELGAVCVCDAAQSAPHLPTDFQALGCDFLAISAHKMLGPTGVGALVGREELLSAMPPFLSGGEMIDNVSLENITFSELPHKFEAGTPDIGGVIAFGAALDYLTAIGMEKVRAHEMEIAEYALAQLSELSWLTIYGPRKVEERGAAISFTVRDIHPHDLAQFLDSVGIAVRAGHHCAQPLHRALGVPATTRASFYIYNTTDEVDALIKALGSAREYFKV